MNSQTTTGSSQQTNDIRQSARWFGIFFILTFLSYGFGSFLISDVTGSENPLGMAFASRFDIASGAILMALVHTFMNIALPVLVLPILKPYNQRLAYGYLSLAIAATITLIIGVIMLLSLIPLGEAFLTAQADQMANYELIATLLTQAGVYAYHMGMAIWSVAGLLFCSLLFSSKLLPRFMAVWGIVGYSVLFIGSVLEIYGHNDLVEMISVIPGGLFEVFLSLWLIFKGFNKLSN
ncbi:MAG: DUF4386 domain-containing protein [Rhizobiales bacterium]|nr:DUF4386 domain-containing protein [Hyphomicrobiales bacterium]NRB13264.1 DUF4386 domain-containing protein [Hyphomicrobiales bacterium]